MIRFVDQIDVIKTYFIINKTYQIPTVTKNALWITSTTFKLRITTKKIVTYNICMEVYKTLLSFSLKFRLIPKIQLVAK